MQIILVFRGGHTKSAWHSTIKSCFLFLFFFLITFVVTSPLTFNDGAIKRLAFSFAPLKANRSLAGFRGVVW